MLRSIEGFDLFLTFTTTPLKDQQYTVLTGVSATTSFIETEGRSYFDVGDQTLSALGAYADYGAVPETGNTIRWTGTIF